MAEEQAGLFTAAQARLAGVRRKQLLELVAGDRVERVQHGVYQLSGTPVERWTMIRAAWLAIAPERTAGERLAAVDPEGVLSHRTAALLLGLGDLDADWIEITVAERRQTRNRQVRLRRSTLTPSMWTIREGLPVTTATHTLRQLALDHTDLGHLATVARDVLLRHDVPAHAAAEALQPAAARYGYLNGQALVDQLLRLAGAPISAVDLTAAAATEELRAALSGRLIPGPEPTVAREDVAEPPSTGTPGAQQ